MLTRIIVSFYSGLIELSLWLLIIIGGIVGYQTAETLKGSDAAIVGGVIGALISFIVAAVVFGGFLVIDEIRRSVRHIEISNDQYRSSNDLSRSQTATSANNRIDNDEPQSLFQIEQSLAAKGYKVTQKGSAWHIREPLGGSVKLTSFNELSEYARGK